MNLTKARKTRARADKVAVAAANRVKHGRTKAERAEADAHLERSKRSLDGHKREEP